MNEHLQIPSDPNENLTVPDEYIDEIRTPSERIEVMYQDLTEKAAILSKEIFTDELEAAMANDAFHRYTMNALEQIDELSSTEVQVGGVGVRIPDVSLRPFHDDSNEVEIEGIAAMYPKEKPLRALNDAELANGYIYGAYSYIIQSDPEKDEYRLSPQLIVKLKQIEKSKVALDGAGANLFEVAVTMSALVSLDGTSKFSVPELQEIRDRNELFESAARLGLVNSMLTKQLNKLKQILHNEQQGMYSSLNNVEILEKIGNLAAIQSKKGEEYSALVSELILDTLGEGRHVRFTLVEKLTDEIMTETRIIGVIMGVNMPDDTNDQIKPSIVVNEVDMNTFTATGRIINFDEIIAFEF